MKKYLERAIFNCVSKASRHCIDFVLLHSVIGPENSRHSLNQSNVKLKPIAAWSPAFSRALGSLVDFTLSSRWFFKVFLCSDSPL